MLTQGSALSSASRAKLGLDASLLRPLANEFPVLKYLHLRPGNKNTEPREDRRQKLFPLLRPRRSPRHSPFETLGELNAFLKLNANAESVSQ